MLVEEKEYVVTIVPSRQNAREILIVILINPEEGSVRVLRKVNFLLEPNLPLEESWRNKYGLSRKEDDS